jgi:hypothetical protein
MRLRWWLLGLAHKPWAMNSQWHDRLETLAYWIDP